MRIAVAVSGGVDSAVAAALVQAQRAQRHETRVDIGHRDARTAQGAVE